ncbi:MAG: cation diffusion facilitator family transporter [Oscillospiraceae bacterium]|nr:cation diffusion facilitator family transporter [Oscillospiraceae bacterium]
MKKTKEQLAIKVSVNTIIWNAMLSGLKLLAGLFGNSAAMLSDAVHSLSDVLSTAIVMVGVKMAGKQSDKDHPYGHERFECVAAIILALILVSVGAMIGWGGVQAVISGNHSEAEVGVIALVAAIVSIIAKEGMYWYTRAAAKKVESGALLADAWHHRSDAMSSVGSFIGILGARLGFPILDPLASVVICLFILKVGYDIFKDSIGKMTDKACDDAVIEEIRAAVLEDEAVLGIDQIKTRLFGDKIYVDLEISLNGSDTLNEAHSIAERVHENIEEKFPKVKHCMIHVNPKNL